MGGSKITIDTPEWVSEEERAWAFRVAQFIYADTRLKYVNRSIFKNVIAEGHSPYYANNDRKSLADSIEIIKVTWNILSLGGPSGPSGTFGEIVFQIVISIPGLEKFTVYLKFWSMNKRRLHRGSIGSELVVPMSVDVNKIAEKPVALVQVGPFKNGEVEPITMAKACIAGIGAGVHFQKYLLMLDLETLNEIQATLLLHGRENKYPGVEISPYRLPEEKKS